MGCLGVFCMLMGLGFMAGNTPGGPNENMAKAGEFLLGGGVLIVCVGVWKEVADRKETRLRREAVIQQVERLAELWKQGAITEEEFAQQKQESLKLVGQQPAQVAGVPIKNPEMPQTPALALIGRMANLWERGAIDDDEFVAFKRPFLSPDAGDPTDRDVAGLAHLESLAEFWEAGTVSDEEYAEQKQKYHQSIDGGVRPAKPAPPSSWEALGGP